MRIDDVNVFKAGTGTVLKAGDPVLVHFAIAASHADIEAEKSLESSYVGAVPLVATLGDESTVSALVSENLIGCRARCTLRLTVGFEGTSGLPQSVAVELWPDNIETDRLPADRFELVRSFPVRDEPSRTQASDDPVASDSQWARRLITNPLARQSSGVIVSLSDADLLRLRTLLTVPNGERAPVEPVPLKGSNEYVLPYELIDFLNKRHLWPSA